MDQVIRPDSLTAPLTIYADSPTAVVMLHGFTGSPYVFRDMATRLHESHGVSVDVPLLPGHGTHWTHMLDHTFEDWVQCALDAVDRALQHADSVTVTGLSMGGALALATLAKRPRLAAGVLVNPAVFVDSPAARFASWLSPFVSDVAGIGGDIARPGTTEYAYHRTPVGAVGQLYRGLKTVRSGLWSINSPVTLCTSTTDHVVASRSGNYIARHVPHVTRIMLRRSYHVATLDYDAPLIEHAIVSTFDHGGTA